MTLPWPVAVFVLAGLPTVGYVFGAARMTKWQNDRYEFFVGENRRLAANLRVLYALLDQPYPADREQQDEPQPGRWDVFVQRAMQASAWVRARFRGPATTDVPMSEPLRHHSPDSEGSPYSRTVRTARPGDTGPDTDEMPAVPGPATQPTAVVIADDWQRKSEALYQQMLAEIRGERVEEDA